jgi:uncharacterized protein (DUF1697 family)
MNHYVSMLRGINVGGQKRVSMQMLKETYSSMGFENIETYVQSGNVIFSSETSALNAKEQIEKEIKHVFGFDVLVFIRTGNELGSLVSNQPFKQKDESKLHVTFLSKRPKDIQMDELISARIGAEDFVISGREIYLFCPNGYGVTKLSNSFFERKLKVPATTRNWRTVNTLLAMLTSRTAS